MISCPTFCCSYIIGNQLQGTWFYVCAYSQQLAIVYLFTFSLISFKFLIKHDHQLDLFLFYDQLTQIFEGKIRPKTIPADMTLIIAKYRFYITTVYSQLAIAAEVGQVLIQLRCYRKIAKDIASYVAMQCLYLIQQLPQPRIYRIPCTNH